MPGARKPPAATTHADPAMPRPPHAATLPDAPGMARPLAIAFVVLYGAGFVGARLGLPHADPFAFLALRFTLAAAIMAAPDVLKARGRHLPGRPLVFPDGAWKTTHLPGARMAERSAAGCVPRTHRHDAPRHLTR